MEPSGFPSTICLHSTLPVQIVNSFSQQFFVVVESAKSEIAVVADIAPKLIREVAVIKYPNFGVIAANWAFTRYWGRVFVFQPRS
jgi:hypothetical protein